jgi:predicted CoA-binding protein
MPSTIAEVRDFLNQRRIALVGVSRDPKDFSRMLFREMCNRGYDMIPVNPAASELESRRCFRRVQQIDPPAEGALVMTPPRDTERVVRDCAEAGIRRVWMHRGGGQGAVSKEAADFCHQKGIGLVEGYCPFMFLSGAPFFHRVHGFLLKLVGRYPSGVQGRAHSGL